MLERFSSVQGLASSGYLLKKAGKTAKAKPVTRVQLRRPSAPARVARNSAVFLVGFMGAGKTSVGRVLGRQLRWAFEDLDDRIREREGRTVAEIFRNSGEVVFRQAEHAALRQAFEELRGGAARIIALGGGAFVQKENAALLKASGLPTVFLDASVDELWQRCCTQASESGTERPLLRNLEQFRKLYEARRENYSAASLVIQTGNRAVEAIAAEIVERLGLKELAMRTEQGDVE